MGIRLNTLFGLNRAGRSPTEVGPHLVFQLRRFRGGPETHVSQPRSFPFKVKAAAPMRVGAPVVDGLEPGGPWGRRTLGGRADRLIDSAVVIGGGAVILHVLIQ